MRKVIVSIHTTLDGFISGPMVIFASAKLVQSFTNLGLIDEYRLLVHPVILGSGKRLFEAIEDRHNLKLVNIQTYKGGAVLLGYQPIKQW